MKQIISIVFVFLSLVTVHAQNGLKNGSLFLLQQDQKTITINSFENDQIVCLKAFAISEKSIYTTDQKSRVVVLDTAKNNVQLFTIYTDNKKTLKIPFDLKPKALLLTKTDLFVGGVMGSEMLVQYNLQSDEWYQLEIPGEVKKYRKAVDDFVITDSLLVAIDNIVIPKYVLFYDLKSTGKLNFSHFKRLKANGPYEEIDYGRLTENYFALRSGTFSGYTGATTHITVYNNLRLENGFSLSLDERNKNYHYFTDFVIVGDKLVIASKEKGLGIFHIKKSYFEMPDSYRRTPFIPDVSPSKIKFKRIKRESILKITCIPNTEKVVLTLQNRKGKIRHEIRDINPQ
jgi:hypothetical protein